VAQIDACDPPPVADAGPDQLVDSGAEVALDGSASADPWGEPFTFGWTEDSGVLSLDDPSSASPHLLAPVVEVETTYRLTLTVDDGLSSSSDVMLLTVRPPAEDTGGDTGTAEGGEGSTDGGSTDSGGADSGSTDGGSADGADGAGDTGTSGADGGASEDGDGADKSGCACSSAGSPAAAMGLLGALVLGLRRRRD
jgi:MYXO-CTERM domain-containing protein